MTDTERQSAHDEVLIWSGEHRAYWRPDGCGYTARLKDAGRYSRADAEARTRHCGPEKQIEIEPITPIGAREAALREAAENSGLAAEFETFRVKVRDMCIYAKQQISTSSYNSTLPSAAQELRDLEKRIGPAILAALRSPPSPIKADEGLGEAREIEIVALAFCNEKWAPTEFAASKPCAACLKNARAALSAIDAARKPSP